MLAVILRLGKYLGIAAIVVFLGVFVWANWRPLSPGEKAKPIIFGQIDSAPIKDSLKAIQIKEALTKLKGVRTAGINFESQIISIGFNNYETDFAEIKSEIKKQFNYTLTPKKFKSSNRVCPMGATLSLSKRIRLTLSIRS